MGVPPVLSSCRFARFVFCGSGFLCGSPLFLSVRLSGFRGVLFWALCSLFVLLVLWVLFVCPSVCLFGCLFACLLPNLLGAHDLFGPDLTVQARDMWG